MKSRIVIDADATPRGVKAICEKVAVEKDIPFLQVSDYDPDLIGSNVNIIDVADGKDADDYKILNIAEPTDIVITHDHGLASLMYTKVTAVIHPEGFVYNAANIDELLYRRYLDEKMRESGHAPRLKRRKPEDDDAFRIVLESFLETFD